MGTGTGSGYKVMGTSPASDKLMGMGMGVVYTILYQPGQAINMDVRRRGRGVQET